jgi:hypothetical protein
MQHLKWENPDFSPTFRRVLDRLEGHFDVDILATRLNFYRDGSGEEEGYNRCGG